MKIKRDYEYWCSEEGLILVAGWRRSGISLGNTAKLMGVRLKQLEAWSEECEELALALRKDKDISDFIVEEAVFNKAKGGDLKACEFWLKVRMPDKWGSSEKKADNNLQPYVKLADLLRDTDGKNV